MEPNLNGSTQINIWIDLQMDMKFVFLATLLWVYTYTLQGEIITGYANSHENERTVSGQLCPDMGGNYFSGNLTRHGKIEAVDTQGNIYLFNILSGNQYSCKKIQFTTESL